MERLSEFEDTQTAMFLLKLSYSIVKAVHFMRTTPLNPWLEHAKDFDSMVRNTAEKILGFRFTDTTYDQACLSTSLGGLGLRKIEEHARTAYTASWNEARTYMTEAWKVPLDCSDFACLDQRSASQKIDQTNLEKLLKKVDDRTKKNILNRQKPHANAWLSAPLISRGLTTHYDQKSIA